MYPFHLSCSLQTIGADGIMSSRLHVCLSCVCVSACVNVNIRARASVPVCNCVSVRGLRGWCMRYLTNTPACGHVGAAMMLSVQKEIEAFARMPENPRIVKLFATCKDPPGGGLGLLLEYHQCGSLYSHIRSSRKVCMNCFQCMSGTGMAYPVYRYHTRAHARTHLPQYLYR